METTGRISAPPATRYFRLGSLMWYLHVAKILTLEGVQPHAVRDATTSQLNKLVVKGHNGGIRNKILNPSP